FRKTIWEGMSRSKGNRLRPRVRRYDLVIDERPNMARLAVFVMLVVRMQRELLTSIPFCRSRTEFEDFWQIRHSSPSPLAGKQPPAPPPPKTWQTGKLSFFSDATSTAICSYGAE